MIKNNKKEDSQKAKLANNTFQKKKNNDYLKTITYAGYVISPNM